jgi:hypothetical protein
MLLWSHYLFSTLRGRIKYSTKTIQLFSFYYCTTLSYACYLSSIHPIAMAMVQFRIISCALTICQFMNRPHDISTANEASTQRSAPAGTVRPCDIPTHAYTMRPGIFHLPRIRGGPVFTHNMTSTLFYLVCDTMCKLLF